MHQTLDRPHFTTNWNQILNTVLSSATSTARLIIDRDCLEHPLQSLSYEYDANGNITKITDTSNTATAKTTDFTYDDLNRLLTASTTNATSGSNYFHQYNYNAIGNITSSTPAGSYAYGGGVYTNPHAAVSVNSRV